jgi:hypothetical protein
MGLPGTECNEAVRTESREINAVGDLVRKSKRDNLGGLSIQAAVRSVPSSVQKRTEGVTVQRGSFSFGF